MPLDLKLNESYLTASGKTVKMVLALTPQDPDYEQGFRFKGDDGYCYKQDGFVIGGIGESNIVQMGAEPIVSLASDAAIAVPGLDLKVGSYYRNGIGTMVQLVREVDPSTNRYKSGYRFIDHQNTYYTASGSVMSWMFKSLDLKTEVPASAVTSATVQTIVAEEKTAEVITDVASTSDKLARASAGAVIGMGVVQAASFALTGRFIA